MGSFKNSYIKKDLDLSYNYNFSPQIKTARIVPTLAVFNILSNPQTVYFYLTLKGSERSSPGSSNTVTFAR